MRCIYQKVRILERSFNLSSTIKIIKEKASSIKRVRKLGKKIENAYFSSSSSFNLRNACDSSIHINKILSKIID